MVMLVIMLIVALVPTAHYAWDRPYYGSSRPAPFDYAICFYNHHEIQNSGDQGLADASLQRMVFSALLLGVGMLNRLFQLFRTPTNVYIRARRFSSHWARKCLSIVHTWSVRRSPQSIITAALLYRPCLAIFLTIRVILDMATSKFFEVRSTFAKHPETWY